MDKRSFLDLVSDVVALTSIRAAQQNADLSETLLKMSDMLTIYAGGVAVLDD